MTTGERIKKIRQEKGLSQNELGARLGVSQQMIGQWETGKANPKLETIQKIAAALNVKLSDLIAVDCDFWGFADEIDLDNYVHELGEFLYYNQEHKLLFDSSMEIKQEDIPLAKELLDRISGKLPTKNN